MRRLLSAACSLTLLAVPAIALANGRFPDAEQLVVDPNDPNHIAVQVTYGFIHTKNGGTTWHWTCEDAASYGGILDPPIAIVDSGAIIAGVFDGLIVSSPDLCTYELEGGELESRFFLDVSTIKGDPTHAIALSSDGIGSEGFDTRVWKSTDTALTWTQLGIQLPNEFIGFTLDAAPSDEDLLYVSGFNVSGDNQYTGALKRSPDGGMTWEDFPIPGSANESGPYIAAIDPNDPQIVYVRLDSLAGKLLVTRDGGETWETVFEAEGKLKGFALSPDGTEVRIGGDVDGLWKANTDDLAFEKMSDISVRCLTWTEDALYMCTREATSLFTIGKSLDAGESFEPIHHLNCLDGPNPECAAGTTIAQTCEAPWGAQKQVLRTDTCNGGTGGGGEGGSGGGAEGGGSSDGGSGDGCSSCATSSTSGAQRGGSLAVLVVAAFAARRKRR